MKFKHFPWLVGFFLFVVIIFASFPAPTLTQLDPLESGHTVTYNAPFTLHFSQVMNRSSAEQAFQILPKIEGEFKWKDLRTLEFHPNEALEIGDSYRLVVKAQAKSLWFKEIGFDSVLNFEVTGPPYVQFAHPADGDLLSKDGVITVMFDRAMNWDALSLQDLISTEPRLDGSIRQMGMRAFQFIPNEIALGQDYQLSIPAGLEAMDGGLTQEAYSWSVVTPFLKVLSSVPETNLSEVSLDSDLKIYFDGQVPLDAIKPGLNALLYPSNDLDADLEKKFDGFFNTEVTYGLDDDGEPRDDVLVFTPSFPYQAGEDYRFVLKPDADLHLAEGFELTFQTIGGEEERGIAEVPTKEPKPAGRLLAWKNPSMEFFIRGENPRLELAETLTEPALLSACQIPSNQFIRITAQQDWDSFRCEGSAVQPSPSSSDMGTSLNLDDYFDLNWVTGVYFVSLSQNDQSINKTFLVEDTSIMLKRSDSELLVWTLDTKSGNPIADMELEILSYDGEVLMNAKTDEFGIFRVKQPFDQGIYVRAKKETESLSRWAFTSDQWIMHPSDETHPTPYGLVVLLNQDVFFPGDTVKIKGIWRTLDNHVLALPEATQVQLNIEDDQQNFIGSKRVPLRRNGSFDSSLTLPENAATGYYRLTVSDLNHQILAEARSIQVQESKNDLQLEWLRADKDHPGRQAPAFILKARYTNGIPAANLQGRFELYSRPSELSHQKGAIQYSFSGLNDGCEQDCHDLKLINNDFFDFNAEGEARLILDDGAGDFLPSGHDYILLVKSALPGGGEASLQHNFQVHQGNFDLGLGLKHKIIHDDNIQAEVISLDYKGEPIADKRVNVRLSSLDRKEKNIFEDSFDTDLNGSDLSIYLGPEIEDGTYVLRAESRDAKRNQIISEELVYVSRNPVFPLSQDFTLVADQEKYFVGGRAKLVINEPLASEDNPVPVLVSYEREGLLGYEALNLQQPVTEISVPIKASMVPHFLVKATRFHRGITPAFSSATEVIEVGDDEAQIFIDMKLDPPLPQPGQEIELSLYTYDYQNRPLSTVVTLNSLSEPAADPVLSARHFYPRDARAMDISSNLSPGIKPAALLEPLDFSPVLLSHGRSIYFDPLITTTESGEAKISFTLPESNEDLFIQAIATKGSHQLGSSTMTVKPNQQLSIKPILPDFVVPGDQTIFGARIKNVIDQPIDGQLQLASPDVAIRGDKSRNFSLQPGQQTEIHFTVFVDGQLDKEELAAEFKSGQDLMKATIPIKQLKASIPVAQNKLTGNIWTGHIANPSNIHQGLGNLHLSMGAKPLALTRVWANRLKAVGSNEPDSTFSMAALLLSELSFWKDSVSEDDLLFAQHLTSKLLKQSDEKGAYHFWQKSSYSPELSALVLLTYKQADELNIHVDPIQLNRTLNRLWESLDENDISFDQASFILWVLGQYAQHDTERSLEYFQKRTDGSIQAKTFLALNLKQLLDAGQGGVAPVLDTLKAELLDELIQEEDLAHFEGSVKSTAIALMAFLQLDADSPYLDPMANYLITKFDGGAGAPQLDEALWMTVGLNRFGHQKTEKGLNYIAQVKLNGSLISDQSVSHSTAEEVYENIFGLNTLSIGGINELFIKKEGNGPLYFSAHLDSYLNPEKLTAIEDGIVILRTLYELGPEGQKNIVTTYKKGGRYISELELIVPENYKHVSLFESIPAGMRLDSGTQMMNEPFIQTASEADRIHYYADSLPAGVYKLNTELQAVLPGHFNHLPASIKTMFDSDVYGQTEPGKIQIID